MDTHEIGKAIRLRRRQLGITQTDLARLAECSKPSVIAAERGKPTLRLNLLITILSVLGLQLMVTDHKPGAD